MKHRKFHVPPGGVLQLMGFSDENDDLWTPEFNVKGFLHKDIELTH